MPIRVPFPVLLLTVVACNNVESDTDSGTTGPTCDTTVTQTYPVDGATGVYYQTPVEFTLSEADPDAVVISSVSGVQTNSEDGTTVVFTPDVGLSPNTVHSFTLDFCGGTPTIQFTTSDFGDDLAVDLDDLIGKTWSIDLLSGRFPAGEGLAEAAASIFDRFLLLGVIGTDDDGLWVRLGVATENEMAQDECYRTVDLPDPVVLDGPDYSFSSETLSFGAYAGAVELMDVTSGGTISADGEQMGGFSYSALVDLREVAGVLDLEPDEDDLCAMAANVNTPCEPCLSDGTANCVRLASEHINASAMPEAMEEIVEANVGNNCE